MFNAWKTNVYWIILSIGVSAGIWMVISGQQNPYREDVIQNVVVEVQNLSPDVIATGTEPSVAVRLSAPLDVWRSIQASSLEAYVDASKVTPGTQSLPVKVESSDWRVRVDSWQPAAVEIQFEAASNKSVPVKVEVIGEAPFGFVSQPATVSPQEVTVVGAESLIARVVRVTADVKLLDATSTVSQQVKPVPTDESGIEVRGIKTVPEMVTVEVPIEQQVSYKTVAVVPRVVGSAALGYQLAGVMVEPTSVTVVGDPSALRDLSYLTTEPINISGATSDLTVNTELELPPSVSVVRPQGIIVRAYLGASEGSQVVAVAPTVTGLSSKLSAATFPGTVQVTVAGPMPVLNTLKAQDVRVELDATGLGAGTHVLSPVAKVPEALDIVSVTPDEVTVIVK